METTIELPDDLYARLKAEAANRGVGLRDLVEEALRRAVAAPSADGGSHRVSFPLLRSQHPGVLSATEVREAEERYLTEEDLNCGGAL